MTVSKTADRKSEKEEETGRYHRKTVFQVIKLEVTPVYAATQGPSITGIARRSLQATKASDEPWILS